MPNSRLPNNYLFSSWVLQSNLPKEKPSYMVSQEQRWDANLHLKVARPNRRDITYTDEQNYANSITQTKDAAKSFNYTNPDKLKYFNNVILDLHDESSVIEKLDKFYDVRDGFQV